MTVYSLFSMAAQVLRDRYLSLANESPQTTAQSSPEQQPPQQTPTAPATDSYEPSQQPQIPTADSTSVPDEPTAAATEEPAEDVPAPAAPDEGQPPAEPGSVPEATYSFVRSSRLNYHLGLQFDLAAVSLTAQQLAEGNVETIDNFTAAGFGLSAALHANGKQVTESSLTGEQTEGSPPAITHHRALMNSRQAHQMLVQDRQFAAQAFHRESTHMLSKLKETEHNGYRRAVNKFVYRFTMDTQFSFAFLQRFNVQTQNMADQMPQSLGDYVTSAGDVASAGTTDIMAAFFDAVDAYLDQAEENIVARVNEFFDLAAEQLGLSAEMTQLARDQLVESVESFFEGVDEALAGVESQFVPDQVEQPVPPIEEPVIEPVQYQQPAVAEKEAEVVFA